MAKYIKNKAENEANHRMEYARKPNLNHFVKGVQWSRKTASVDANNGNTTLKVIRSLTPNPSK